MEFTHIANPVRVQAQVIRDVITDSMDAYYLTLENGSEYVAGQEMTARYKPQAGDYLVRQEDGYEYLNPKDVFERKYRSIGAEIAGDSTTMAGACIGASDEMLRITALEYANRNYSGSLSQVVSMAKAYFEFLKGAA